MNIDATKNWLENQTLSLEVGTEFSKLVTEVERLEGESESRWQLVSKELDRIVVLENEKRGLREALKYLVEVRKIKCSHPVPFGKTGEDYYLLTCAKCKADKAIEGT